jgi:hypothetical protein
MVNLTLDPIVKKDAQKWAFLLLFTSLLMIVLLVTGENSLNFTFIIFLLVVKFLAGLGVVMGIISISILILKKYPEKFDGEGNQKKVEDFNIGLIVLLIVLLIYKGPIKITQSFLSQGSADNIFDDALFIYGIVSLMINLYIKPLLKQNFITVTTINTGDMIKSSLQDGAKGVKKWWLKKHNKFGEAQLEEQQTIKKDIDVFRQRMAVVAMLFLGIGSIVFLPIGAIFMVMWYLIFFKQYRKPHKFEEILLIIACIAICIISVLTTLVLELTPFYVIIRQYYFIVEIFHFIGLIFTAVIFIRKLIPPIIRSRKDRRKKELEAENKQLKKQLEQIKKPEKGTKSIREEKKKELPPPPPESKTKDSKKNSAASATPAPTPEPKKKESKKNSAVPPTPAPELELKGKKNKK